MLREPLTYEPLTYEPLTYEPPTHEPLRLITMPKMPQGPMPRAQQ